MILKITIDVEGKGEAYNLVNEIGFEHEVIGAEYGNKKQTFDKDNKPKDFLKNKLCQKQKTTIPEAIK